MRFYSLPLLLLLFHASSLFASVDTLIVDLGSDTLICQHDQLPLVLPDLGDTVSYDWSTGDTTTMILVNNPGIYSVTLTSPNCVATDSIMVSLLPAPVIVMSSDTSVCPGESVDFEVMVNGNADFLWSNGAETNTITVSTPDTYSVTVTQMGCDSVGSVTLDNFPLPMVDLGPDTSFCAGDSILLEGPSNVQSYNWSTGATTPSIFVSETGTYSLEVTSLEGCIAADTVEIGVSFFPIFDLGPDVSFCDGESINLEVPLMGDTLDFLWSTGAMTNNITVSTAGEYWVEVSNGGCATSDTVLASILITPIVDLGPDTAFCNGDSILLQGSLNGVDYAWSTGASTASIFVSTAGTYWLEATSTDLCTASDTVEVEVNYFPNVDLGPDFSLCDGESVGLEVPLMGDTLDFLWSTGAMTNNITVTMGGEYWVAVDNQGCVSSDTVQATLLTTPTADFQLDTDMVCGGVPVTLLNSSNIIPGGSLNWDMGDGINFNSALPIIDYLYGPTANGMEFTITLTADNGNGCLDIQTAEVNILLQPTANFSVDPVCEGVASIFMNESLDLQNPEYFLDFGDGLPSLQTDDFDEYEYIYNGFGNYLATLVVENDNGCVDDTVLLVAVLDAPEIAGLMPDPVCFGNETTLEFSGDFFPDADITWSFGDDSIAMDDVTIINHVYPGNGGNYTASVTVENPNGCAVEEDFQVVILQQPFGLFSISEVCLGVPTQITNLSDGVSSGAVLSIDFGNGFSNNYQGDEDVEYVYPTDGIYNVTLTLNNGNTCTDVVFGTAIVNELPDVQIDFLLPPPPITNFCVGDTPVLLTSSPDNGNYSGLNISVDPNGPDSIGIFDPQIPGSNYFIYYEFTNPLTTCEGSDSLLIANVFPLPDLSITGIDAQYCVGDPVDTIYSNITDAAFFGDNVIEEILPDGFALFDPSYNGTYDIFLDYTDENGCYKEISELATVNALPDNNLGNDLILVPGEVVTLSGGMGPNLIYIWSTGAMNSSIDVSNPGFYILTVTDTVTTCSQTDTVQVILQTSTHGQVSDFEVKIFPNPAHEVLYFEGKLPAAWREIYLINEEGQVLEIRSFDLPVNGILRTEWEVATLPSGMYWLKVGETSIPFFKE